MTWISFANATGTRGLGICVGDVCMLTHWRKYEKKREGDPTSTCALGGYWPSAVIRRSVIPS